MGVSCDLASREATNTLLQCAAADILQLIFLLHTTCEEFLTMRTRFSGAPDSRAGILEVSRNGHFVTAMLQACRSNIFSRRASGGSQGDRHFWGWLASCCLRGSRVTSQRAAPGRLSARASPGMIGDIAEEVQVLARSCSSNTLCRQRAGSTSMTVHHTTCAASRLRGCTHNFAQVQTQLCRAYRNFAS